MYNHGKTSGTNATRRQRAAGLSKRLRIPSAYPLAVKIVPYRALNFIWNCLTRCTMIVSFVFPPPGLVDVVLVPNANFI